MKDKIKKEGMASKNSPCISKDEKAKTFRQLCKICGHAFTANACNDAGGYWRCDQCTEIKKNKDAEAAPCSAYKLKVYIKAANTTQEKWSATQGISEVTASRMVTRGCVVINGRVYSPTKYSVKSK